MYAKYLKFSVQGAPTLNIGLGFGDQEKLYHLRLSMSK